MRQDLHPVAGGEFFQTRIGEVYSVFNQRSVETRESYRVSGFACIL